MDEEVKKSLELEPYEGEDKYIFISYSHKDKEVVLDEIKNLMETGYKVWFDEGITPGREWPSLLSRKIKQCGCFIVFISKNSVQSDNVQDEINLALQHKKHFIAIFLEETHLPDGLDLRITRYQNINKYIISKDKYNKKLLGSIPLDCIREECRGEIELKFQEIKQQGNEIDVEKEEPKDHIETFTSSIMNFVEKQVEQAIKREMQNDVITEISPDNKNNSYNLQELQQRLSLKNQQILEKNRLREERLSKKNQDRKERLSTLSNSKNINITINNGDIESRVNKIIVRQNHLFIFIDAILRTLAVYGYVSSKIDLNMFLLLQTLGITIFTIVLLCINKAMIDKKFKEKGKVSVDKKDNLKLPAILAAIQIILLFFIPWEIAVKVILSVILFPFYTFYLVIVDKARSSKIK